MRIHIHHRVAGLKLVGLFVALLIAICAAVGCSQQPSDNSESPIASDSTDGALASADLDGALASAVLDRLGDDTLGEANTEGYIILSEAKDGEGNTVVYAVASYASYGFENGIFTVRSGCGAIPAVIVFSGSGDDYTLLSYTEPQDGVNNEESKKALFPSELWSDVLNADQYYPELQQQQVEQAQAYLTAIGRDAEIEPNYVEKQQFNISSEAFSALTAIKELYEFPYWVGSQEFVVDGVRYIYEAGDEDDDGYSVLTFTEKDEAGNVLQLLQYKVSGGEVSPMQKGL